MNAGTIERSVTDGIGAALSALLLLGVMLLTNAQQANAQEDFSECVDGAFAEYNSCLMNSTWWLSRTICDLDFEADVVRCGAEQVGQIKGALQAH